MVAPTTATPPAETESKAQDEAHSQDEAWAGWNLAGDKVKEGISKYNKGIRDELLWHYAFAQAEHLSMAEAAKQVGIDHTTYSRVMRGAYKGQGNTLLSPPAMMLSRIRILRKQNQDRVKPRYQEWIETPTVLALWMVFEKVWKQKIIGFIFGESHLGKTLAATWYCLKNNHGRAIYVDLQGCSGVQEVYREFARSLNISPNTPINKLKPRVISALDETNLVIVDEFHQVLYSYLKGSSKRMVEAVKNIKDRSGCAMVIISTNDGKIEFETGEDAQFLKQIDRRGVVKHLMKQARMPNSSSRSTAGAWSNT